MKQEINGVHVTLKEYVDHRFCAIQRAVDKAEESINFRLAQMNEFRASISDTAAKTISRNEVDLIVGPIMAEMKILRSAADVAKGEAMAAKAVASSKASTTALIISTFLGAAALLLSVIGLFK